MSADLRRPHTVLLLSRGYGPDVRAQKEAHTLAAMGWRVSVIAWDRAGVLPRHNREIAPGPLAEMLDDWPGRCTNSREPVTVTHLRIAAGYGTGRRLLGKTLRQSRHCRGRRFAPARQPSHTIRNRDDGSFGIQRNQGDGVLVGTFAAGSRSRVEHRSTVTQTHDASDRLRAPVPARNPTWNWSEAPFHSL